MLGSCLGVGLGLVKFGGGGGLVPAWLKFSRLCVVLGLQHVLDVVLAPFSVCRLKISGGLGLVWLVWGGGLVPFGFWFC